MCKFGMERCLFLSHMPVLTYLWAQSSFFKQLNCPSTCAHLYVSFFNEKKNCICNWMHTLPCTYVSTFQVDAAWFNTRIGQGMPFLPILWEHVFYPRPKLFFFTWPKCQYVCVCASFFQWKIKSYVWRCFWYVCRQVMKTDCVCMYIYGGSRCLVST
jgi:hypothetical protein